MLIYLHKILPALINPVMLILYLLIFTYFFKKKNIIIFSFFFIYILSLPVLSNVFISFLEKKNPPSILKNLPNFNYIIILSGMVRPIKLSDNIYNYEFSESVDRILVAIDLFKQKKTKNIILTKGKLPWSVGSAEGDFLKEYLIKNGVKSENILLTDQVENTEQEARQIKNIIKKNNLIKSNEIIGLITSSFHMPRAIKIFTKNDINIFPIAVDFRQNYSKLTIMDFIPSSKGLDNMSFVFREGLGILFYKIKYSIGII